ncbi:MAG: hypothetical protein HRT90_06730 [Candidatus Margulisbacteria bacterium]|nr:hypothetical protein [Candidatus Margulisiibacteriota bacterium]
MSQLYEEDEIDLLEYVSKILKHKYTILLVVVISMVGCVIYNYFAPRYYYAETTFFLPKSSSTATSGLISQYARILGSGAQSSDFGGYLSSLVESNRIQLLVANDLKSSLKADTLPEVLGQLELKRVKLSSRESVQVLSYEHQNPEIVMKVIASYFQNLGVLNQELDLSVQKQLITVLDPATLPISPSKPNKKKNLMVTLFGALFGSIVLILSKDFITNISHQLKKVQSDPIS